MAGSSFSSNLSAGIATNANGGNLQTNITDNIIVHGAGTQFRGLSGGATSTGNLPFTVTGNTITANSGASGVGPSVIAYANIGSGNVNGSIGGPGALGNTQTNNTPALAAPGGTSVVGVSVINNGAGSAFITVNNNTISVNDGFGIIANAQGTNAGAGHFHLLDNTVTVSGSDITNTAVSAVNSSSSASECLNIFGNTLTTNPAGNADVVIEVVTNTGSVYQVQQTAVTTSGPFDFAPNNQQVEIDIRSAQSGTPAAIINSFTNPSASFTPGTCTTPSGP